MSLLEDKGDGAVNGDSGASVSAERGGRRKKPG